MTRASPGDRIIIQSGRLGGHDRDGEVLEARGAGGTPPFLVRWSDDGRVSLVFPGPDAVVHDGSTRVAPSPAAGRWE
ncbi:DUF1918 domain-containing protein [Georgenia yuyongxinii]|uniref:DUF1918 domain-containing protein n=1 Tax=Georgenia yuyongxinii TaxID=2589797 RepID=A0A552WMW7_9MICO|nr:DUF1918 domain-containing protein [Georgenia yuyongxinii]TRW44092.1 DUF1918 domain-containing protein [Georgenia yuyongxinii]